MSTPPDQNAAFKAMFQAGNAMAQGFGQFLAEQQQKLSASPAGANPAAWTAETEALKALQQEWMGRHAELWQGMLGKPVDQPSPHLTGESPEPFHQSFQTTHHLRSHSQTALPHPRHSRSGHYCTHFPSYYK